eukprot:scaffold5111_cov166-Amphora_coffeaeformis.AAC.1
MGDVSLQLADSIYSSGRRTPRSTFADVGPRRSYALHHHTHTPIDGDQHGKPKSLSRSFSDIRHPDQGF